MGKLATSRPEHSKLFLNGSSEALTVRRASRQLGGGTGGLLPGLAVGTGHWDGFGSGVGQLGHGSGGNWRQWRLKRGRRRCPAGDGGDSFRLQLIYVVFYNLFTLRDRRTQACESSSLFAHISTGETMAGATGRGGYIITQTQSLSLSH